MLMNPNICSHGAFIVIVYSNLLRVDTVSLGFWGEGKRERAGAKEGGETAPFALLIIFTCLLLIYFFTFINGMLVGASTDERVRVLVYNPIGAKS